MAVWQSEEERGDVPHAGVLQKAPQNVQYAEATGQRGGTVSDDVLQRPAAVEGLSSPPQLIQQLCKHQDQE